jgi:hypothetical protein
VRWLNENNAEAAMASPEEFRSQPGEMFESPAGALELELLPYAVVRIDNA